MFPTQLYSYYFMTYVLYLCQFTMALGMDPLLRHSNCCSLSLVVVNKKKKKKIRHQPMLLPALVGNMASAGYFHLNQQTVST